MNGGFVENGVNVNGGNIDGGNVKGGNGGNVIAGVIIIPIEMKQKTNILIEVNSVICLYYTTH